MTLFLNLVRNETMKIFKRTGTKVMFIILFASILTGGLLSKFVFPEQIPEDDWETHFVQQNAQLEEQLESDSLPPAAAEGVMEQISVNTYHLEENIVPLSSSETWYFILNNAPLVSFLTMFTVIIGAGIIAGEHANGTVKLLLIRPVKRWKILVSKWTAVMVFSTVMLGALIAFSIATGFIFFGPDMDVSRYVDYSDGGIRDMHILSYGGIVYGLSFIELIMMTTFAFMIGTVFRNQSLAIGLSLVLLFTGGQIVYLMSSYEWMKYVLFANTYMLQYFEGESIISGMSPGFSVMMLLIYFAIFKLVSIVTFSKRDVAD